MPNYQNWSNYSNRLSGAGGDSVPKLSYELPSLGPVSADRILYASASGPDVADKDVIAVHDKIIGWTVNAVAALGDMMSIVGEGFIEDTSWTFTPGPIYLGNSGEPTQVAPTTGIRVQVATAITATSIYIDIGVAIKLA